MIVDSEGLRRFASITIPCLQEHACIRYTAWSFEFAKMLDELRAKDGRTLLNLMAAQRNFLRNIDIPEKIALEIHLMRLDALCVISNFDRDLILAELFCMAPIVAKQLSCPSLHSLQNLSTPVPVTVTTKAGTYGLHVDATAPKISCLTLRIHIANIAGVPASCVKLFQVSATTKRVEDDEIVQGVVHANVRAMPPIDSDLMRRMAMVLLRLNCASVSPRQLLFFLCSHECQQLILDPYSFSQSNAVLIFVGENCPRTWTILTRGTNKIKFMARDLFLSINHFNPCSAIDSLSSIDFAFWAAHTGPGTPIECGTIVHRSTNFLSKQQISTLCGLPVRKAKSHRGNVVCFTDFATGLYYTICIEDWLEQKTVYLFMDKKSDIDREVFEGRLWEQASISPWSCSAVFRHCTSSGLPPPIPPQFAFLKNIINAARYVRRMKVI
jgi:hypothetical protein